MPFLLSSKAFDNAQTRVMVKVKGRVTPTCVWRISEQEIIGTKSKSQTQPDLCSFPRDWCKSDKKCKVTGSAKILAIIDLRSKIRSLSLAIGDQRSKCTKIHGHSGCAMWSLQQACRAERHELGACLRSRTTTHVS